MVVRIRQGNQGRIVLPRELRDALGAETGAVYAARVEDGAVILEPQGRVLARLQERARAADPDAGSWVDELLAQRRAAAAAESEDG